MTHHAAAAKNAFWLNYIHQSARSLTVIVAMIINKVLHKLRCDVVIW